MNGHPPTERQMIAGKHAPFRWRLIAIGASVTLVALFGGILLLRSEDVEARAPGIGTDPSGVSISFNRGRWTKAVVVLNGVYMCSVGDLEPGDHIITWNRFQGPSPAPLNQPMISTISLKGEVDGKPRVIDCNTTTGRSGPGTSFSATSYRYRDED